VALGVENKMARATADRGSLEVALGVQKKTARAAGSLGGRRQRSVSSSRAALRVEEDGVGGGGTGRLGGLDG
jgi:hypothetical protein